MINMHWIYAFVKFMLIRRFYICALFFSEMTNPNMAMSNMGQCYYKRFYGKVRRFWPKMVIRVVLISTRRYMYSRGQGHIYVIVWQFQTTPQKPLSQFCNPISYTASRGARNENMVKPSMLHGKHGHQVHIW